MNHDQIKDSIKEIITLYQQYGKENYIGESVSQIEHMCQCAQLAEKQGFDDDIILAAFFHDIGHLCEHITDVYFMQDFGVIDHEEVGYQYLLKKGFSQKIAYLVKSHVQAKRYLTYKDSLYYSSLSPASKQTLEYQGGPMSLEEATLFETDPLFDIYIQLRKWDDQAKQIDIPLPTLDKYEQLMENHLLKQFNLHE
ncbi:MAG: HDIG domain-containing protein [Chitinophagaceae bacterium]|nr:HDIG domain-containing protein [Chitinophagaceae bacterium]